MSSSHAREIAFLQSLNPMSFCESMPYSRSMQASPPGSNARGPSHYSPNFGDTSNFSTDDQPYKSSSGPTPPFSPNSEDGMYRSAAEDDPKMELGQDELPAMKDIRSMGLAAGGMLSKSIVQLFEVSRSLSWIAPFSFSFQLTTDWV